MKFKGSPEIEEFWSYLENETPRGKVIVVAAYLDEKLGELLGQTQPNSFYSRINDAAATGLLTQNEHDDLHVIRGLRNSFAHDLKAKDFDSNKARQVDALKTWQVVAAKPEYSDEYFPTPLGRLMYVAGAFFVRFSKRDGHTASPLPEPSSWDDEAFPPVTDR